MYKKIPRNKTTEETGNRLKCRTFIRHALILQEFSKYFGNNLKKGFSISIRSTEWLF